jgi:hypothetical protein
LRWVCYNGSLQDPHTSHSALTPGHIPLRRGSLKARHPSSTDKQTLMAYQLRKESTRDERSREECKQDGEETDVQPGSSTTLIAPKSPSQTRTRHKGKQREPFTNEDDTDLVKHLIAHPTVWGMDDSQLLDYFRDILKEAKIDLSLAWVVRHQAWRWRERMLNKKPHLRSIANILVEEREREEIPDSVHGINVNANLVQLGTPVSLSRPEAPSATSPVTNNSTAALTQQGRLHSGDDYYKGLVDLALIATPKIDNNGAHNRLSTSSVHHLPRPPPPTLRTDDKDTITCSQCTFLNVPHSTSCSQCGQQLLSPGLRFSVTCTFCGHQNHPSLSQCEICNDSLRPAALAPSAAQPIPLVTSSTALASVAGPSNISSGNAVLGKRRLLEDEDGPEDASGLSRSRLGEASANDAPNDETVAALSGPPSPATLRKIKADPRLRQYLSCWVPGLDDSLPDLDAPVAQETPAYPHTESPYAGETVEEARPVDSEPIVSEFGVNVVSPGKGKNVERVEDLAETLRLSHRVEDVAQPAAQQDSPRATGASVVEVSGSEKVEQGSLDLSPPPSVRSNTAEVVSPTVTGFPSSVVTSAAANDPQPQLRPHNLDSVSTTISGPIVPAAPLTSDTTEAHTNAPSGSNALPSFNVLESGTAHPEAVTEARSAAADGPPFSSAGPSHTRAVDTEHVNKSTSNEPVFPTLEPAVEGNGRAGGSGSLVQGVGTLFATPGAVLLSPLDGNTTLFDGGGPASSSSATFDQGTNQPSLVINTSFTPMGPDGPKLYDSPIQIAEERDFCWTVVSDKTPSSSEDVYDELSQETGSASHREPTPTLRVPGVRFSTQDDNDLVNLLVAENPLCDDIRWLELSTYEALVDKGESDPTYQWALRHSSRAWQGYYIENKARLDCAVVQSRYKTIFGCLDF